MTCRLHCRFILSSFSTRNMSSFHPIRGGTADHGRGRTRLSLLSPSAWVGSRALLCWAGQLPWEDTR